MLVFNDIANLQKFARFQAELNIFVYIAISEKLGVTIHRIATVLE